MVQFCFMSNPNWNSQKIASAIRANHNSVNGEMRGHFAAGANGKLL